MSVTSSLVGLYLCKIWYLYTLIVILYNRVWWNYFPFCINFCNFIHFYWNFEVTHLHNNGVITPKLKISNTLIWVRHSISNANIQNVFHSLIYLYTFKYWVMVWAVLIVLYTYHTIKWICWYFVILLVKLLDL